MFKKIFFLLIFPLGLAIGQDGNKIQLANEYYQQGDIKKAKLLFEQLLKNTSNLQLISNNYLKLLKSTGNYDQATNFSKKLIDKFPSNIQYQTNLAGIYQESGEIKKLNKYIEYLRGKSKNNPFQLSILAQNFINEHLYNEAILFYKDSRILRQNPTIHALELASTYWLVNDKSKMIEEYLNYASNSPNRLNYIKNLLQSFIREDEDFNEIETILIKKIQKNPDNIRFYELLLWIKLQRGDFYAAFIEAKAIDKRNKKPGNRLLDIGRIALENKSYDDAEEIFEYVANEYSNSKNYQYAKKLWMETKEQKIKNTYPVNKEEIRKLANQYRSLYRESYPTLISFEVLRKKALLHAFYLNEIDTAVLLLSQLINNRNAEIPLISQSKLDLGDIYLLKGEPWEATLLYSQVDKAHQSHQTGYNAKLRNARLNYFIGNFSLAKDYLNILKKNTTRDISNDAIALKMLITDNTMLDTTDEVMREFANIELLIFQNKKIEANRRLSQMLDNYTHHSITDEIFWLKSELELELGNVQSAIDYLDKIITSYPYDILADDATFIKAEIFEHQLNDIEQAKVYYQQILTEYPGSMYVAEARKKFRQLRGDFIK